MAKGADEVRQEFRQRGQTIADWAREHGFPVAWVHAVLIGHNKGYRGQAHRIAVALGMKDSPE